MSFARQQAKEHRPRAAPANHPAGKKGKKKRGHILERHADYIVRAKDHHRKRDTLLGLRRRARDRNPDEFYRGMVKKSRSSATNAFGGTQKGVHTVGRVGRLYGAAELKKMRWQDANYIRTMMRRETKRIEWLTERVAEHGTHCEEAMLVVSEAVAAQQVFHDNSGAASAVTNKLRQPKRVILFDDAEDAKAVAKKAVKSGKGTTAASAAAVCGKGDGDDDFAGFDFSDGDSRDDDRSAEDIPADLAAGIKELKARMARRRTMGTMLSKLETQRNLMGKGRRRKIVVEDKFGDIDESKTVYKWKLERKR